MKISKFSVVCLWVSLVSARSFAADIIVVPKDPPTPKKSLFVMDNGLDEAREVCQKLHLQPSKDICLETVNKSSFYSKPAIRVCASLNTEGGIHTCMIGIAEKDITESEANDCAKKILDSEKRICLTRITRKRIPQEKYLPEGKDKSHSTKKTFNNK
jgi:hypothetical protein